MGTEYKDLDIDKSLSVYELWKDLTVKLNVQKDVRIAVNHKYVDKDFKLNYWDEVAYFPPVTGG